MDAEQPLDAMGQQQQENDDASLLKVPEPTEDKDPFDAEQFKSLMQQELIAYNFSWDPLMKVLQTLGYSMARQQQVQKSNNDSVDEMSDMVDALRGQLNQVESEKKDLSDALAQLQGQMQEMQSQLASVQQSQEQLLRDHADGKLDNDTTAAAINQDSAPPDPQPTAKDLADMKDELTKHLQRSLSRAFGEDFVMDDASDYGAEGADGEVKIGRVKRAPFASDADVKDEVSSLRELQDSLQRQLAARDQQIDELKAKVDDLNNTLTSDLARGRSSDNNQGSGSPAAGDIRVGDKKESGMDAAKLEQLERDLAGLKSVQENHDQELKQHQEAIEKNNADIKALLDGLDDMALQQQTTALMFAAPSNASGSSANHENAPEAGRRNSESSGQLDLSLVFTKLADLRRSTDSSLAQLQHNIKDVANTTENQQTQLDAIRNGLVFNQQHQIHALDAKLALQKELLNRNQVHQERTKPQLAEWRTTLEQNEDKLMNGLCDDEILQELQQLQRHYRRTLMSMTPLINSPLTIAESLQMLVEHVKQLQHGVQAGALPLHFMDPTEDARSRTEREEEYSRKLRYLDEEIDATQRVNVSTEKKNDPLIKSLDNMMDKLDSLWSLWHINYNQRKRSGDPTVEGHEEGERAEAGSDNSQNDGLRGIELRLMGAVRRLAMVEDDMERLSSVAALNTSEANAEERRASKASSNMEIADLRKEMQSEIARLAALLTELQRQAAVNSSSATNSSTSLVPVSGRRGPGTQNDLVNDLMKGRSVDGRFSDPSDEEAQRQLYDSFLKEVTKKVSHAVLNADKTGARNGAAGAANAAGGNPNMNYRLLLENFTQKVEDRLDDARELTAEELARLRKELADQLKARQDAAMRELRAEFMIYFPTDTGDSTAVGTKPVMCVACSRPVPVSNMVREAGSLPPAELIADTNPQSYMQPDYDFERHDDDYVFRAGFRMPANDRKIMTLPFLANSMRNKLVLNKPEGKRKRPIRQNHNVNRVENVVREALELDRASSRLRHPDIPPS